MSEEKKIIGILTSGGDAPGMNAAVRAIVRTAAKRGIRTKGILKGFNGLINEEVREMYAGDVSDTIQRGGTILYTARSAAMMTSEGQAKAASNCRKHGLDCLVVIGGDGSFKGALALSKLGVNVIGIPGTIDLDVACTDYTIGFDTAVNTAMEAIDRIKDTSTSHERCSIVEVMGRHAGYMTAWCGLAGGAEEILLPETYDHDEIKIIDSILERRRHGRTHHIIVNAEGIGHSAAMAKRIEAATGIETRATVLGYMQRGGNPSCKDRLYASVMGTMAVDLFAEGKKNRVIVHNYAGFTDMDMTEALAMEKGLPDYLMHTIDALTTHNTTWD